MNRYVSERDRNILVNSILASQSSTTGMFSGSLTATDKAVRALLAFLPGGDKAVVPHADKLCQRMKPLMMQASRLDVLYSASRVLVSLRCSGKHYPTLTDSITLELLGTPNIPEEHINITRLLELKDDPKAIEDGLRLRKQHQERYKFRLPDSAAELHKFVATKLILAKKKKESGPPIPWEEIVAKVLAMRDTTGVFVNTENIDDDEHADAPRNSKPSSLGGTLKVTTTGHALCVLSLAIKYGKLKDDTLTTILGVSKSVAALMELSQVDAAGGRKWPSEGKSISSLHATATGKYLSHAD